MIFLKVGWTKLDENFDPMKLQEINYKFGTLKYGNGVSNLELFQGPNSNHQSVSSGMPLYRIPNVLGYIANSDKYIYIPEISTDRINCSSNVVPIIYNTWYLNRFSITNFVPQNLSSKVFNKLILDFTLLNDWITPAFKFEEKRKGMQTIVRFDKSTSLAYFTYKGQLFNVELVGHMKKSYGRNNKYINYKNDSWISINGENTIPSDQAIFFATEFKKMLSVVLARPLNTTQLSKKGIDKCTQKPLTEDIYFLEPRFKNNEDKLFIYEMFLQNIDIQLNNLIPNWFNKDENVELMVQDYLLTITYNETVQNKLINLTEGIEAYYRDKDETLYRKLQDMLYSLPSYILDVLRENVGDLDAWLLAIKDTRVYIAHGIRRVNVIDDFMRLSQYVNAFQYLTQYFILQELGMKIESKERVKMNLDSLFNTEEI